jgi:hypothetical protein
VDVTRLDAEAVLQYPFSKERALDVDPAFLAVRRNCRSVGDQSTRRSTSAQGMLNLRPKFSKISDS